MRIAQQCYALGEWYPITKHVYADYIWAPGFINYLILQLNIWGTLNLILQVLILWLIVVSADTELPFLCLSLTALYLTYSPKPGYFLLAGFLLAIANWIRPVMAVFLLVILVQMVWKRMNRKCYAALFLTLFLTIGFIGTMTEKKLGYFV